MMDEARYCNAFKIILDSKIKNKDDDEINLLLQGINLKISNFDTDKLILKEKMENESPVEIYFIDGQKYIKFVNKSLFRIPFEEKYNFLRPIPIFKDEMNFQNPFLENKNFIKMQRRPKGLLNDIVL